MKIEHVALYVNELEEAREFFIKYLDGSSNAGYHNKNTGFRSYFISFGDGSRLEIMNKPGLVDMEKNLNRTGYAHVAFSAGSTEKALMCAVGQKCDWTDRAYLDPILDYIGISR